jgi:hypothetical protein
MQVRIAHGQFSTTFCVRLQQRANAAHDEHGDAVGMRTVVLEQAVNERGCAMGESMILSDMRRQPCSSGCVPWQMAQGCSHCLAKDGRSQT